MFLAEVYQAIERIQANRYLYAEVSGIRRVLLKQFPYSILYRLVTNDCIRIPVIRHHRRHPVFGSTRS
jgi:plasmid stabilization system protein ParE